MSANLRNESPAIIGHLADQIGARSPGSPQEATAAAFVNARLRRAGMRVSTTPLRVAPRRRTLYSVAAALGLFASLTAVVLPLPALLLALALIIILLLDMRFGPIAPLGSPKASQTIVGTRAIASSGQAAPPPRWRVVLLAPLDTPTAPGGLAALASPSRSAGLARVAALALVAAAALLEQLSPQRGWAFLVLPVAVLLTAQLAAALRPPRPAGRDGGVGALAALLLAAQHLGGLERVEIWAVAVGATTVDSYGVESLLARYPFGYEQTLLVAIEQLHSGELQVATAAGQGEPLLRELLAVAREHGAALAARPPDSALEAPQRRGRLRGLRIYSAGTPAAPLDPGTVERAVGLLVALAHTLERHS
jgi:hypothetical protein